MHNKTLLWLCLCASIATYFGFTNGSSTYYFFPVVFILSFIGLLFRHRNIKELRWTIGMVLFGFLCFWNSRTSYTKQTSLKFKDKYPIEIETILKASDKINQYIASVPNNNAKILLSDFHPKKNLTVGKTYVCTSPPKPIREPSTKYDFDNKLFNQSRGIFWNINISRTSKITELKKPPSGLNFWLYNIRKTVKSRIDKLTENGQFRQLLYAITIGDKSTLSTDTKKSFVATGTIHILAVSGLHTGIFYLILQTILGWVNKKNKHINNLVTVFFLICFCLISGMAASVLRASLIIFLIILGKLLKKEITPLSCIATAYLILILIWPYFLFNLGFQFSFAAFAGVMLLAPYLQKIIKPRNYYLHKIWELSAVSIAAQLTTFPISAYYFGKFPLYFLPANLIIIPLTSILLPLALLGIVVAYIPYINQFIGMCLMVIFKAMTLVSSFFASLPYAMIHVYKFTLLKLSLLIGALFFYSTYWVKKRLKALYLSFVCAFAFPILTLSNLSTNEKKELIIDKTNKQIAGYCKNKHGVIITNISDIDKYKYQINNWKLKNHVTTIDTIIYQTNNDDHKKRNYQWRHNHYPQ